MTAPAMQWVPCELHAHTFHSDGRLSVEEMAREARRLGLEVVALTDHNTNSGVREIADAEGKTGMTIVPGMELTTFHGHLLALGTSAYIEWRSLTKENVGSALDAIHASGALAGVAHPFHEGNPFCTGCRWDFDGPDWDRVDYLEVWSEANPWSKPKNALSLALWTDVLNAGHRVVGVSSRDFHAPDPACIPAVTYLGVAGRQHGLVAGVKEALRAGRALVTLGPLLFITVRDSGRSIEVDVAWDSDARRPLWEPHVEIRSVELHGNQGKCAEGRAESPKGSHRFTLPRKAHRWIRAELHGRVREEDVTIAFTNPVWLEK
jgi:hypothetical protein